MHELSIAQSILSIAEKVAPPAGEGTVTAINIKVGELSSIEMDALQFAFSAVKEDTVLQKAALNIEIIPGEAHCQDCGVTFHLPAFGQPCPKCSSFSLKITGGREMKVTSLTVEE